MAVKTYFVVMTFSMKRGRLAPDPAVSVNSQSAAERMAVRLAEKKPGVIAFSRTGDPEGGDFEAAQILARFGDVPDEALELLAA